MSPICPWELWWLTTTCPSSKTSLFVFHHVVNKISLILCCFSRIVKRRKRLHFVITSEPTKNDFVNYFISIINIIISILVSHSSVSSKTLASDVRSIRNRFNKLFRDLKPRLAEKCLLLCVSREKKKLQQLNLQSLLTSKEFLCKLANFWRWLSKRLSLRSCKHCNEIFFCRTGFIRAVRVRT